MKVNVPSTRENVPHPNEPLPAHSDWLKPYRVQMTMTVTFDDTLPLSEWLSEDSPVPVRDNEVAMGMIVRAIKNYGVTTNPRDVIDWLDDWAMLSGCKTDLDIEITEGQ